jgi:hypothetical protein
MIKKISQIIALSLLLFSVGYSAEDSNGVWHKAEDIRGGVFGSDDSTPEFFF